METLAKAALSAHGFENGHEFAEIDFGDGQAQAFAFATDGELLFYLRAWGVPPECRDAIFRDLKRVRLGEDWFEDAYRPDQRPAAAWGLLSALIFGVAIWGVTLAAIWLWVRGK